MSSCNFTWFPVNDNEVERQNDDECNQRGLPIDQEHDDNAHEKPAEA